MEKLTVYEKPTCTTCKKVVAALQEKGMDFDKVNYFIEPFSKEKLVELIKKMDISPKELLRKRDKSYKELQLDTKDYSDEELINFMVENPNLVQRPILELGDKAVLGRPIEKIYTLFD